MGNFRLAFNIVVADSMQQVPPSRGATEEEWIEVLTAEIDRRFGGYEGDALYHIAIAVDGYSLAPPGIPLVLSPKSILIVSANVWDDAAQAKLHEEPNQITVFEGLSGATILGSGLVRSREEQMQVLARNMARRIQLWMLENPELVRHRPRCRRRRCRGHSRRGCGRGTGARCRGPCRSGLRAERDGYLPRASWQRKSLNVRSRM